ncbi:MAG: hypothetical protein IPM32_16800 [Ignavibacteriae bacterium]|nr:hypothetical protein [Ignavibacteriota bacterium]
MKENNLLHLTHKIKNETITQTEINFLIEHTFKIAISFLKNNYKAKINHNLYYQDTIEDLAIDSIVPLFIKNNTGILGIKRSLENWTTPIISEEDAAFFFSKIIWKRTDQALTNLIKEKDPFFEKIIKNLNLCVAKNNLKKLRYFGTVYIVRDDLIELDSNLIKYDSFRLIPNEIFGFKQIVLFDKLFEYLRTKTEFTLAIPLNLLVRRIKEFYLENSRYNENEIVNEYDEFIYEDILKNGLNSIQEKIDIFYIPNERLSKDEAELMMASFHDIAKDMLNGEMSGSLFDYLKFRNNNLTSEQFYKNYHTIMNNLLKNLKKTLTESLI